MIKVFWKPLFVVFGILITGCSSKLSDASVIGLARKYDSQSQISSVIDVYVSLFFEMPRTKNDLISFIDCAVSQDPNFFDGKETALIRYLKDSRSHLVSFPDSCFFYSSRKSPIGYCRLHRQEELLYTLMHSETNVMSDESRDFFNHYSDVFYSPNDVPLVKMLRFGGESLLDKKQLKGKYSNCLYLKTTNGFRKCLFLLEYNKNKGVSIFYAPMKTHDILYCADTPLKVSYVAGREEIGFTPISIEPELFCGQFLKDVERYLQTYIMAKGGVDKIVFSTYLYFE
ncbi:MAG: hypothetical protein IJV37_05875 [Bacteroidales bacterium]|nr:hypothetical protein [Bacteroidales bacterium]